ncbi:MAG: RNA-binding protein [Candidatus Nomurabacteria bacterium]|jgi:RNA recognition motif-containing protein|nr:RNA-binding protein [Candidatus Nomurabacteria bacterium]
MDNKPSLFVGSLNYKTRDDALKAFFEQVGPVAKARVIMEKENPNRSRGFGFVEFDDEADLQKAIDQLNGQELDGRAITVNMSQPRK